MNPIINKLTNIKDDIWEYQRKPEVQREATYHKYVIKRIKNIAVKVLVSDHEILRDINELIPSVRDSALTQTIRTVDLLIDELELSDSSKKSILVERRSTNDIIDITAEESSLEQLEKLTNPDFSNNKIFVVHGHNDAIRESVARVIEKLDLIPIILFEQANKGDTIIEKLEHNSDVSFAVVILSEDDIGYSNIEGESKKKPRARQNVILELGYFIGKLGRKRVVAIFESSKLEKPSDYDGVVYIPYQKNNDDWKLKLCKEFNASGYQVDSNKLM